MFLVVKVVSNELPDSEYGIDDTYSVVGLFSDEERAKRVAKRAKGQDRRDRVSVVEVTPDKTYPASKAPEIGRSKYYE